MIIKPNVESWTTYDRYKQHMDIMCALFIQHMCINKHLKQADIAPCSDNEEHVFNMLDRIDDELHYLDMTLWFYDCNL